MGGGAYCGGRPHSLLVYAFSFFLLISKVFSTEFSRIIMTLFQHVYVMKQMALTSGELRMTHREPAGNCSASPCRILYIWAHVCDCCHGNAYLALTVY